MLIIKSKTEIGIIHKNRNDKEVDNTEENHSD